MKRVYFLLLAMAMLIPARAQQQKWKAPKQPKRAKWVAPKQPRPEVIDVWRPYSFVDNWYIDFLGGTSTSLAENMGGHGFGKITQPMFDFGFGKQFSHIFSTRLTIGYKAQSGWASKEALAASSLLEKGGYTFKMATFYVDEMLDLTHLFLSYNEKRRLGFQLFAGVGLNYSFSFDDKVKRWARYGYPVDGTDFINVALRGGLLASYQLSEVADVMLQGTINMVGDDYNGVRHSPSFAFESYVDVSLGIRVHLPDHYGDYRYWKVRRWEASSLRTTEPRVAGILDGEKEREYTTRAASERPWIGTEMKTRITFYIDRYYVSDQQMENLRLVADFLKKNPGINLIVRGYSAASTKEEVPNMHLAERRAEAVQKALIKYYEVEPERLSVWFDESATAPYPMKGEWIDGVIFQIVERE